MHIPDGILDAKTAAAAGVLAASGVGVALYQVRRRLPPRRVPLMGLAAAFVFAAQMLNFPVAGGASGHLVGGVLAAVLLGPSAAVIVMAAVLIVQCFLFADGGVLALGANMFNMGIVSTIGGYGIYRAVRRWFSGQRGVVLAAAFAGWCAIVLAAISCAGQLAASGVASWPVAFPAMAGFHMLIGIGEGLITALVIVAIARTRPELVEDTTHQAVPRGYGQIVGFGLLLALGLALFVAPFASPWPDGLDTFLERAASTLGLEQGELERAIVPAPIRDYKLRGVGSETWATALAGAIGTVVVFALAFVLARVLVPEQTPEES